jgi:hypothetical protein
MLLLLPLKRTNRRDSLVDTIVYSMLAREEEEEDIITTTTITRQFIPSDAVGRGSGTVPTAAPSLSWGINSINNTVCRTRLYIPQHRYFVVADPPCF